MKKLLLVGVSFLALGPAGALAQGVFDHLKCHVVKDPLTLKHSLDLDALQPDFSDSGCKLRGKAKYFCVPVTKKNVDPAPPLPNVVGQTLQSDYTCYTLKCPTKPPLEHDVTDQFGGPRHQSKYNTQLLCVPSYKDSRPCGFIGIRMCGGACPNATDQCQVLPDDSGCVCGPITLPDCEQAQAPACNGSCATGGTCQALAGTNMCKCQ